MANDPLDLETVIEDSINDATSPDVEETVVETSDDTTVVEDAVVETTDDTTSTQVETPGQKTTTAADEDPFAKQFGLQAQSVTGRENRIPYSRVKKIVEKNERDTVARVTKEIEAKYATFPEIETKVKDYEGRLEKVAQFENILENDAKTFLGMLSQHPSYKEFFAFVEKAAAALEGAPKTPTVEQPYLDAGTMPPPDQTLTDGSKVYSLEGLAKRDEWLAKQIEAKVVKQAEDRLAARYAPIEQAWQSQEQMAKIVPVVEKQIAEARTWDQFNELEPKILELLKADKAISLERAYLKAYQEWSTGERTKLVTDKNKVRSEVLAELKKKPVSTSTTSTAVKPTQQPAHNGPRDMEDIIRESLDQQGLLGQ